MTIEHGIELRKHTTFHVGGPAEFFTTATSAEEIRDAVRWAVGEGVPWRVIGEGSNILFGDALISGLTIRNASEGITFIEQDDGVLLTAASGVMLDVLAAFACEKGWWGLENLSGIPGTVGAVPIQNVGAYGVEVADLIRSVGVYDVVEDTSAVLPSAMCRFGYRHSLFKEREGARYVIESVTFWLPKTLGPRCEYRDLKEYFKETAASLLTPLRIREAVLGIRSQKFPDWRVIGTAGSFFKNPTLSKEVFAELRARYPELPGHITAGGGVKVSLAWIIDHVCEMRGVRIGNVGTYGAQALVIVNYGNATAKEIISFAEKIILCVKEKINIDVECEVTHIV